LKADGYKGFLSLEYECRFIDELEGMKMSVKNMNAILNEI
jgi:sugar phosphate isomerase/epimerase